MSVSTIIPFVNNVDTLDGAIASVLAIPACTQLLLVDDGSTDGSVAVARQWAMNDKRVQILQTEPPCPRGAGYARNLGIQHAQGTWITFLDADDYYLKSRFDMLQGVIYKNGHENVLVEATQILLEQPGPSPYAAETINNILAYRSAKKNGLDLFLETLHPRSTKSNVHLNAIAVKKSYLTEQHLLFDPALMLGQDVEWKFRLWNSQPQVLIGDPEKPVAVYRVHPKNRSIALTAYKQSFDALLYKKILQQGYKIPLKHRFFLMRLWADNALKSKHASFLRFRKIVFFIQHGRYLFP